MNWTEQQPKRLKLLIIIANVSGIWFFLTFLSPNIMSNSLFRLSFCKFASFQPCDALLKPHLLEDLKFCYEFASRWNLYEKYGIENSIFFMRILISSSKIHWHGLCNVHLKWLQAIKYWLTAMNDSNINNIKNFWLPER